jgi:hypothetical protein
MKLDFMKILENMDIQGPSPIVPSVGDTIRTEKTQMTGKVEGVRGNMVFFREGDGRLMKTDVKNVSVVQPIADEDDDMVCELSTDKLTKYKTAAAADARAADATGNIAQGNKRFHGIVQATKKQFANDAKKTTKEGTMGGINRCAPAQDVSYEKMLDEIMKEEEMKLNELSVGKMQDYVDTAKSTQGFRSGRSLGKIAKTTAVGVPTAKSKINAKTGNRTGSAPKYGPIREQSLEERLATFVDEAFMNPWHGYVPGEKGKADPKLSPGGNPNNISPDAEAPDKKLGALAKAPKTSMQGKDDVRFSELVQDTIETHGIKWAFNFYVVKHGLPPRQFRIFAGI